MYIPIVTYNDPDPVANCNWWNNILFTRLLANDIIAVAAAGSPGRLTLPVDCPHSPFIVASSSDPDNHGLAPFANQGDVYAPGSIPPNPQSTPTSCPSQNIDCRGPGVPVGQVSGLVAYFLSLSAQNPLYAGLTGYNNENNVAAENKRWVEMKSLLVDLSYPRIQRTVGGPPVMREIWNGVGCTGYGELPRNINRMKRDGTDGIFCTRPSSSTSTIPTIPTHHALNNNGSSTLTTLSTLIKSSGVLTT